MDKHSFWAVVTYKDIVLAKAYKGKGCETQTLQEKSTMIETLHGCLGSRQWRA